MRGEGTGAEGGRQGGWREREGRGGGAVGGRRGGGGWWMSGEGGGPLWKQRIFNTLARSFTSILRSIVS